MATKRKTHQKRRKSLLSLSIAGGIFLLAGGFGAFHYVFAKSPDYTEAITYVKPNFGIKNKVTAFFEANDAAEMIPIIKCESRFRHYDKNGDPLQNAEGSSAIGVAQILTSMHPDPKVIERYNKRNDMDLTVDDFDVTTFDGNIGYALVLYKMNGTRDWECSKKFRF